MFEDEKARSLNPQQFAAQQYGHLSGDNVWNTRTTPIAPGRRPRQYGVLSPDEIMHPLKKDAPDLTQVARPTPTAQPAQPAQPAAQPAMDPWRQQILDQVKNQGTSGFDWSNLQSAVMGMGGTTRGAAAYNAKALNNEQDFVNKAQTVNRQAYEKPIYEQKAAQAKAENEKAAAAQAKQADEVRKNELAKQQAASNAQRIQAQAQSDAARRQKEAADFMAQMQEFQMRGQQDAIRRQNRDAEYAEQWAKNNANVQAANGQPVQQTQQYGTQVNPVGAAQQAQAVNTGIVPPAYNTGITGGMTGINNQVPAPTMSAAVMPQNYVEPTATKSTAPVMRPLPTQTPTNYNTGITGGMTGINNQVPAPTTQTPQLTPQQRYNIQQLLQRLAMLRSGGNI